MTATASTVIPATSSTPPRPSRCERSLRARGRCHAGYPRQHREADPARGTPLFPGHQSRRSAVPDRGRGGLHREAQREMTKGSSEATVAKALADIDDPIVAVWKPPDDARNWKPADYLVWFDGRAAMIEVKDCPAMRGFPFDQLRPTQRAWAYRCRQTGTPYLLVIHWQRT